MTRPQESPLSYKHKLISNPSLCKRQEFSQKSENVVRKIRNNVFTNAIWVD